MRMSLEPYSIHVRDCRDLGYTSVHDWNLRLHPDMCPIVNHPQGWVGAIPFALFMMGAIWSIYAKSKR